MAEITNNLTPYHYCLNNPISNIDPTGMYTETADAYVYSDPDEIAAVCKQLGIGQGNKDSQKKEETKKEYPEWKKTLAFFLYKLDESINFYSDFLGGPEGENVSTADKLEFQIKTYAYGELMVIFFRAGQFSLAKRQGKIPNSQQPFKIERVPMTTSTGAAVLDATGKPIITREYYFRNTAGETIIIQDHSAGHNYGGAGDQGSHFNVRPEGDTRNGKVEGTQEHYPFEK